MEPSEPAQAHHPKPKYWLVFLALAALTGLEVYATTIPGIPLAPTLIAMSIAKALMVIFYFMHLRYDSRWLAFIFFAPFLLVIPLILVMKL